jgi:oligopeptidase B
MWIKRPRGRASTERHMTPEPLLLARRQLVAGGLGIVSAAACWSAWLRCPAGAADGPPVRESPLAPTPPRARQDPWRRVIHGVELVDEYAWLRAPNWRAALDDPTLLPPDILNHLRAEDAYAEGFFASLRDMRERIAAEMQADMDPRWLRPPQPFGPYLYEMRYGDGEQPLLTRRPRAGGPETILLNCNELAKGQAFFKLGSWRVSPDHRRLAYAIDVIGSESYRIHVRDLETGVDLADSIADATSRMVWSRNGQAFTYVKRGPDLRPSRVMHHRLGTTPDGDAPLYAEADPAWSVSVSQTTSQAIGLIAIRNSDLSEVHLFDLASERPRPRLVQPRAPGLSYEVDHWNDRLLIRANLDGAEDYKLVTAPIEAPAAENWRDFVPHRPGVTILDHRVHARHIVRTERRNALVRIVVREIAGGTEHEVEIADPVYSLRLEPGCDFDTDTLRFTVSTPIRPNETYDYGMTGRTRTLVRRQAGPAGVNLERYELHRLWAAAADGERVPISIVHRRGLPLDGSAPCLLYGYGAYGWSVDPAFAVERLPLLERGFVYAIAHVRGGSEKGQGWYRAGKLENRTNAFADFLSVAEALIAAGYTRRGRIVAHGRSAGGMLVGAALNWAPDLFAGVIADVPFVDVLNTMLDEELPLTPSEWLEWGNPIRDAAAFLRIRSYSPYEQIRPEIYPPVLATAGLSDPRVTYWEPAKWILRLRDRTAGGLFLLVTELHAGHGGNEGRTKRLDDRAREIAFALRCVGLA